MTKKNGEKMAKANKMGLRADNGQITDNEDSRIKGTRLLFRLDTQDLYSNKLAKS